MGEKHESHLGSPCVLSGHCCARAAVPEQAGAPDGTVVRRRRRRRPGAPVRAKAHRSLGPVGDGREPSRRRRRDRLRSDHGCNAGRLSSHARRGRGLWSLVEALMPRAWRSGRRRGCAGVRWLADKIGADLRLRIRVWNPGSVSAPLQHSLTHPDFDFTCNRLSTEGLPP